MLLADIVRIGRPIIESNMSIKERIELLTDVGKNEVKNFYGNVFIIELEGEETRLHFRTLQDEENGPVNLDAAIGMPITLPSGGNPINAQGIYPIPCYPMYEKHIKGFENKEKTKKMVLDRLVKTIPYFEEKKMVLEHKAEVIAGFLKEKAFKFITGDKPKGVLFILDRSLNLFSFQSNSISLQIQTTNSGQEKTYIDSNTIIENIIEGRFQEAKELGREENKISTMSNELSEELVSAYNKSWLWLSPTWESPKSIYWENDEWTKGIRLNRKEYEAFFYGSQFLKQVQTPINVSILKEMFAPINSAEAKKHMKPTSFDPIFGIPYFLPLTKADSIETYTKFQNLKIRTENSGRKPNDIQLEIISGLQKRIMHNMTDDYRITIIYYSGNLGRGDIHIRGQVEDVVPSIAAKVQGIIKKLDGRPLKESANLLKIPEEHCQYTRFKVRHLPTLLSNAYGPGYLWTSMNQVLHGQPIGIKQVRKQTSRRINELVNKSDLWGVRFELLFYHLFASFYHQYTNTILNKEVGNTSMDEWKSLLDRYMNGELANEDLDTTEKVGFISGCIVQQFERSYYAKVGKGYLDTRIMRFGSKLTPEMVWKNGLLKMEELKRQRDLGIKQNYEKALAITLPTIIRLKENNLLAKEKDEFMTMFWSGYLMLPRTKKEEVSNDNQ